MLKLKLQYLDHLMQKTESLEKTMILGKIEGKRRRGQQRMRWLDNITDSMDMNLSNLRKIVKDRGSLACYSPWGYKELDMIVTEQKLKKELRSKEIHLCILLFIFIYFLHHFHKGFAATCYIYMAPHSSPLAWRIPRTGEPGGLLSMGSHRVRHD